MWGGVDHLPRGEEGPALVAQPPSSHAHPIHTTLLHVSLHTGEEDHEFIETVEIRESNHAQQNHFGKLVHEEENGR